MISLYQKIAGILCLLLLAAGFGLGQPKGAIAASSAHSASFVSRSPAHIIQVQSAAAAVPIPNSAIAPSIAAGVNTAGVNSAVTHGNHPVNPERDSSYLEFTPRQSQRLLHSDLTSAMMTGSHLTSAHLFTSSLLSGQPTAATKTIATQPQ